MAKWAKTQHLTQEYLNQIQVLYNDKFPIEVRHYLADWIEENFPCDSSQLQSPQIENSYELYVKTLIEAFIQEIESRYNLIDNADFLTKMKLATAANYFKTHYQDNYIRLYEHIKKILHHEDRILRTAGGELMDSNSQYSNVEAVVAQQMNQLLNATQEISQHLRKLEEEQEGFTIRYHEVTKLNAQMSNSSPRPNFDQQQQTYAARKQEMERQLRGMLAHMLESRIHILEKMKSVYNGTSELQGKVLDEELNQWKREQQLNGNGATFNASKLELIQEWCENLAELIWQNRQSLKEFDRLKAKLTLDTPVPDNSANLLTEFTQLLSTLVTSSFVIEKQPPQVMKTNTRFTATVRLLVSSKLNVYMTPPQVKVTIISEQQANVALKTEKGARTNDVSGEILNNTGVMEYQANTRQLSASFRNMQLKKIKRAEKKGTESVMDEKFSLLFQSHFSVAGGELTFQVWTLSLPVVVIVHGNQEPHAWATVTWDNAFSELGRIPFSVPDKVPWYNVAETLSLKFQAATGRPLEEEHLRFLGEKAFRGNFPDPNQLLSWAQFCKEPLPDRNFTFWEWFYAIMKLTREHLRGPWVDGAIIGFISKKAMEELLQPCPNGTFALRFSDSELGGITIGYKTDVCVSMIQPFTAKDFSIRSLADRISDFYYMQYLYPAINKDEKFGKYYAQSPMPTNGNTGYIRTILRTHIDETNGGPATKFSPQRVTSPEYTIRDTNSVASFYSDGASISGGNNLREMESFGVYNELLDIDFPPQ